MAFSRIDALALVKGAYLRIGESQDLITDTEIISCIDSSIEEHSKAFPQEGRWDVIGNGEYNFPLPDDWSDNFSVVLDVEYPVGFQNPELYDRNSFKVVKVDTDAYPIANALLAAISVTLSTVANAGYFKKGDLLSLTTGSTSYDNWASANGSAAGVVTLKNALAAALNSTPTIAKQNHFRLLDSSPLSTELITIVYSLPHVLDDDSANTTLPVNDAKNVIRLSAYYVALAIAANFGKYKSSSITADSVDYAGMTEKWMDIADKQLKIYNKYFGIGEEADAKSGGIVAELDMRTSTGEKYFWQGSRYR